ncbi:glyoxalase [Flavobacteriaceae bacterium S0825]|uniref:VOC family protein n=1 Tax=Gaetbulibacter sp. S0825 TaxID=2720084 RepID=UPI00142FB997|nr:glyoxalase [Gaetbulibacter sp. S0825]MCK0107894.1 glyoxalase [Flavobacteriaceae bacterium S0825]NIX63530.1 glyoxalase [Gaetbulibacter sp. S0825]
MKIKDLFLYTNKFESEKRFYSEILGFKIHKETIDSFTLKIGWSKLTFIKSDKAYKYHYCFLIPSNKLESAMQWMEKRTRVIDIENGRKTQRFETWNADSFYFFDASGNIAEFIVRHDLKNQSLKSFSIEDVVCVNEIGLPTTSIETSNTFLEKELDSYFWKGDKLNFGTNGTQEGLFLLPNYKTRTKWFPTNLRVEPSPFKAVIESNSVLYDFEFLNEDIIIKKK